MEGEGGVLNCRSMSFTARVIKNDYAHYLFMFCVFHLYICLRNKLEFTKEVENWTGLPPLEWQASSGEGKKNPKQIMGCVSKSGLWKDVERQRSSILEFVFIGAKYTKNTIKCDEVYSMHKMWMLLNVAIDFF